LETADVDQSFAGNNRLSESAEGRPDRLLNYQQRLIDAVTERRCVKESGEVFQKRETSGVEKKLYGARDIRRRHDGPLHRNGRSGRTADMADDLPGALGVGLEIPVEYVSAGEEVMLRLCGLNVQCERERRHQQQREERFTAQPWLRRRYQRILYLAAHTIELMAASDRESRETVARLEPYTNVVASPSSVDVTLAGDRNATAITVRLPLTGCLC
jgi:hypothetical protein